MLRISYNNSKISIQHVKAIHVLLLFVKYFSTNDNIIKQRPQTL